ALATARAWPSWEQQGAVMALALRRIASDPPPSPRLAGRRLVLDNQTALAVGQRATLELAMTATLLCETRDQRAYQWGVAVRGAVLRVLGPVRGVVRRVRRR